MTSVQRLLEDVGSVLDRGPTRVSSLPRNGSLPGISPTVLSCYVPPTPPRGARISPKTEPLILHRSSSVDLPIAIGGSRNMLPSNRQALSRSDSSRFVVPAGVFPIRVSSTP